MDADTQPTTTTRLTLGRTGLAGLSNPIVVGVDGSREAQRALGFAGELALRLDVELIAVHVLGLRRQPESSSSPDADHVDTTAELLRTGWCQTLAEHDDLRWRSEVVRGSAVSGLLRAADTVDAALVVIGSHGAGQSGSRFLGSTSHEVVHNSRRPIIVIPPGDDHRHQRTGSGAMNPSLADQD